MDKILYNLITIFAITIIERLILMAWGTEWMLGLLGKNEIKEIIAEASSVSGCSLAYKDNAAMETFAYSKSEEFLCTVRSCPLYETIKKYEVRQIIENNIIRGYLVIGDEMKSSPDGDNLIEVVVTALKLLMRRNMTRKTQEVSITGNLFAELINGEITTQEALSSRLRLLSIQFEWHVAVLSVEFQHLSQTAEQYLQELFFNKVVSFFPDSYIYCDGTLFSCIVALKRVTTESAFRRDMQAIADQVCMGIEPQQDLQKVRSYWGCGKIYPSLLSLRTCYYEASQSVVYAKKFLQERGRVIFWNDTGAFRLIGRWASSPDADEFYKANIKLFQNHEYLLETLDGLDSCNWNLSLAAEKLACHYNTLKYRYKKIKEIFASAGRDIDSHEIRFDIAVFLKLHKIHRKEMFVHEEKDRRHCY